MKVGHVYNVRLARSPNFKDSAMCTGDAARFDSIWEIKNCIKFIFIDFFF